MQSRQPIPAVRQPCATSPRGAVRREDPVQVEHRADVRIPGVAAPLPRRIGDHGLDLGHRHLGRVGEVDRVVVGLRHLAAVRPGHLGDRGQLDLGLDEDRAEQVVEPPRDLPRQLDVGRLVDADRHVARPVDQDVGRLEQGVAQEPVGRRLDPQLLDHLLVRGHALQPRDRRDHREEQVELRVLGHERLHEDRAPLRVEARTEPVGRHLQRVGRDLALGRDLGRERVPVGHEVEALVVRLEPHPVVQGAEVVPEMEAARRPHARQDARPPGHRSRPSRLWRYAARRSTSAGVSTPIEPCGVSSTRIRTPCSRARSCSRRSVCSSGVGASRA